MQVKVGRAYGRVSRRKLREHLLKVCREAGVAFLDAEVGYAYTDMSPPLHLNRLYFSDGEPIVYHAPYHAAG